MGGRVKLHKLIKSFGATLDEGGWIDGVNICNIDAPQGKTWNASNTHSLVFILYREFENESTYRDAIERMNYGLSNCEEQNCDVCNPNNYNN